MEKKAKKITIKIPKKKELFFFSLFSYILKKIPNRTQNIPGFINSSNHVKVISFLNYNTILFKTFKIHDDILNCIPCNHFVF